MLNDHELFEVENRYCQICGNFIKAGYQLHRCLDKDIKKIEIEYKLKELYKKLEEHLSYDDILYEFNEFYNSDNYYDDVEEG